MFNVAQYLFEMDRCVKQRVYSITFFLMENKRTVSFHLRLTLLNLIVLSNKMKQINFCFFGSHRATSNAEVNC